MKIAERVADENAYQQSAAYRSSLRKGASWSVSSLYQRAGDEDLKAMGRAMATPAQERLAGAFQGGAPRSEGRRGVPSREGGRGGGEGRRVPSAAEVRVPETHPR